MPELNRDGLDLDSLFTLLGKLYALADELQDSRSANLVIDKIIRWSDDYGWEPTGSVAELVYSITPEGSPLRKLFVQIFTHEAPAELEKAAHELPQALLAEIAVEYAGVLRSGKTRGTTIRERRCKYYHRHDEGADDCNDDW